MMVDDGFFRWWLMWDITSDFPTGALLGPGIGPFALLNAEVLGYPEKCLNFASGDCYIAIENCHF